jgi:isochorismate pyruvate lyase
MAEVRAGVDALDAELLALLATRFGYMRAAARIKPSRDAVRDEARKASVIAAAVAEASCLGFPTALMTALGIFAIASASAFLGDSLNIYTGADMENAGLIDLFNERLYHFSKAVGEWRFWTALKVVTSSVGEFLLLIVPSFGPYDAVTLVATGRVVSTADVLSCLAKVGLAGGGVLSLAAAALFHGRDLVVIGE